MIKIKNLGEFSLEDIKKLVPLRNNFNANEFLGFYKNETKIVFHVDGNSSHNVNIDKLSFTLEQFNESVSKHNFYVLNFEDIDKKVYVNLNKINYLNFKAFHEPSGLINSPEVKIGLNDNKVSQFNVPNNDELKQFFQKILNNPDFMPLISDNKDIYIKKVSNTFINLKNVKDVVTIVNKEDSHLVDGQVLHSLDTHIIFKDNTKLILYNDSLESYHDQLNEHNKKCSIMKQL